MVYTYVYTCTLIHTPRGVGATKFLLAIKERYDGERSDDDDEGEGEEIRETGCGRWFVGREGTREGFWSLVPPEVPATSDDKTEEAQATARRRDSGRVAMVVVSRIPRGN